MACHFPLCLSAFVAKIILRGKIKNVTAIKRQVIFPFIQTNQFSDL